MNAAPFDKRITEVEKKRSVIDRIWKMFRIPNKRGRRDWMSRLTDDDDGPGGVDGAGSDVGDADAFSKPMIR